MLAPLSKTYGKQDAYPTWEPQGKQDAYPTYSFGTGFSIEVNRCQLL